MRQLFTEQSCERIVTLPLQKMPPGNSPESREVSNPEVNSALLPVPVGPLRITGSGKSGTAVALSLILPTLNEAENIQSIVEQLDQTLKQIGIGYEIIIVDDDSPDRTWEHGLAMAQTLPGLRVMRRIQQRGLATAVVRGWQAARGEILGVIDADLQHPPALLPELWRAITAGADLAVASRWAPGGGVSDWNSRRRLISRTAQAIGRVVLPDVFGKVSDPLSGFFLVRREKLAEVSMDPRGYKILIEVLARGRIQRISEVSYVFRERVGARSKVTWRVYRDYLVHLAILRWSAIHGS